MLDPWAEQGRRRPRLHYGMVDSSSCCCPKPAAAAFSLELTAEGGDVGEMHAMDDVPTAASPGVHWLAAAATTVRWRRDPDLPDSAAAAATAAAAAAAAGGERSSPMPIAFLKRPLAAASSFGTGSVSPLMESTLAKAAAAAERRRPKQRRGWGTWRRKLVGRAVVWWEL